MADETTSLPVSPLRITVRPQSYYDQLPEQDFSGYLNNLPVEQSAGLVSVPPTYGVPYSGTLPVKVNKAIEQTWPVRMVQSGVSLPKDVYEGKVDPTSEEGIQRTQDLAGMGVVGPLAMKPGTASLGSGMSRKYPTAAKSEWYGEANYETAGGRMQTMTPDEFLAKGKPLRIDETSRENIDLLKQHIEEGKTLDPLKLYAGGKEDGRHRAIAAKELGIKEVPVINFREPEIAPAFYSAVEQTVKNAKMTKGTADQWIGYLRNQAGVKPEELQWTGLIDLPAGKSISKAELEQHIVENKVQLKEVVKGDSPKIDKLAELDAERIALHNELNKLRSSHRLTTGEERIKSAARMKELADRDEVIGKELLANEGSATKYKQYHLPGGENYKETLLMLPHKEFNEINRIQEFKSDVMTNAHTVEDIALARRFNPNFAETIKGKTDQEALAMVQQARKQPEYQDPYKSSHWDEPNVLAHIRHNDRDIPTGDGKTLKSLHIEEIQSDWHQAGRKEGYKPELEKKFKELVAKREQILQEHPEYASGSIPDDFHKLNSEIGRMAVESGGVPDAPFKKTWDELALKRMIREASERGMDAISWTPGEAQAARYDLSKQIKQLHYTKTDKGYILAPESHSGQEVAVNSGLPIPESKLADYIGKEVADKIIKGEGKGSSKLEVIETGSGKFRVLKDGQLTSAIYKNKEDAQNWISNNSGGIKTLEGLDLKVGGEGMKAFYDKMLVDKANAIAKKFGGKVETKTIVHKAEDSFMDKSKNAKVEYPVHVLRITPQMREHALTKGFPLFSSGLPIITPVSHDPFKHKLTPVDHNPFTNPNAT